MKKILAGALALLMMTSVANAGVGKKGGKSKKQRKNVALKKFAPKECRVILRTAADKNSC